MRARTTLFGALGGLATGFGLAVLLFPDTVRSVGPLAQLLDAVGSLDPTGLMLVAGLLVGGYATVVARSPTADRTVSTRSDAERRFETADSSPPERVTARERTITAGDLDADIESAIEHGDQSLEQVRSQLVALAADVCADATGQPLEAASTAVENGTWTTDQVAAAFLSETREPIPTVRARLALWLRPQRERRRRIERAIAAIEHLDGTR
jgi:hypothetical protein